MVDLQIIEVLAILLEEQNFTFTCNPSSLPAVSLTASLLSLTHQVQQSLTELQ